MKMSNLIKTEVANSKKQILHGTEPMYSVGVVVDTNDEDLVAGTPMKGNLKDRQTAFVKAETTSEGGTKGVTTLKIDVAAVEGDQITIEGRTFTCGATENVENKVFAGADAEAQVVSLLKMIDSEYWDAEADASADTIKFTQKVAETGRTLEFEVGAGATLDVDDTVVTEGVSGTSSNDAVGVLLHDVKKGDTNAALLIFGFVDLNKVNTAKAGIDIAVENALDGKVCFLK